MEDPQVPELNHDNNRDDATREQHELDQVQDAAEMNEVVPVVPKKRKPIWREWLEALAFAFIGVLILKTFFFEPFAIPSDSMEKSLLAGDYVVVNKLAYGARIPMTPLSIPFSHQDVLGLKAYTTWFTLPYMRVPGYSDVKRNDIIVFNFPAEEEFPIEGHTAEHPPDHKTHFIKRCIGLPGDTLQLVDGEVMINGKAVESPSLAMFGYTIKIDSAKRDSLNLDQIGMARESYQGRNMMISVSMMKLTADSIRRLPFVISVDRELSKSGAHDDQLHPRNEIFPWNLDQYGPLIVPKEGMTVSLHPDTLSLYEDIIVNYEHHKLEVIGDSVYIDDKLTKNYTFTMNYYFVMGDNRHYSMDSRYWGFVPEDHIVGRASLILFSYDKKEGGVRWGRMFSAIQ
ncbi:MAG: signal peptidase I [Bacteroidetes bacterium]|nr:signal peptidase I [Bacteroidota bacterium]